MAIFLDTGDINEIKKYLNMGIIKGVTTNPTILLRSGVVGGMEGIKDRTIEIANLIAPLPLSVEVISNNREEMISQAKEFSSWANNINLKITIHGPNGEIENLSVIHELETKYNIIVNATAMMSAQQCFLAAMAGATYVSLFCGRVNNIGYDSRKELALTRSLLDKYHLKAKIIAASSREIINVIEWLDAGAHIVTVAPNFIDGMIIHPYTKETVKMFLQDGAKLNTLENVSENKKNE